MRKVFVTLGVAGAMALGLAGASVAQTSTTPNPPATAMPHDQATMDAMHAQMRDRLPADVQAKHDEMHAQMSGMMSGGMMPGGMMSGHMGNHMGPGGMMGS
jgi:hypothetical protein